jgi:hypothetical protein
MIENAVKKIIKQDMYGDESESNGDEEFSQYEEV